MVSTAVPVLPRAFCDMVMVELEPVIAVMVVPDGMKAPVMGCPTMNPAML